MNIMYPTSKVTKIYAPFTPEKHYIFCMCILHDVLCVIFVEYFNFIQYLTQIGTLYGLKTAKVLNHEPNHKNGKVISDKQNYQRFKFTSSSAKITCSEIHGNNTPAKKLYSIRITNNFPP